MDYHSNSRKNKEKEEGKPQRPPIEPVVKGKVIEKKPPLGQRIKVLFFGGEAKSVTRYLAVDVLLPTIRNLIVDATTKGVERMVYGESVPRSRRPMESFGRFNYSNPLVRDRPRLPDQSRTTARNGSDIVLISRDEAELVLERLNDIVEKYEVASVADLYELIGLPVSHVDQKWGWTDLRAASIKQVREGYLLNMPQVEEI